MSGRNMAESWGVLAAILIFCFTITGAVIAESRTEINAVNAASIQRDIEHEHWGVGVQHENEREYSKISLMLNTISINQKRTMEHLNLEYLTPERLQ